MVRVYGKTREVMSFFVSFKVRLKNARNEERHRHGDAFDIENV